MSNSYTDKIKQALESKLCCLRKDLDSQQPVALRYNGTTGELTQEDQFGTETTINLPLEQFLSQASYDDDTNILTLTRGDNTTFTVDLNDLLAVAPKSITFTEIQDINTNKLLGRSTAGTGVIEQISIGTGLSLSGGTLTNSAPDQVITISGATGTYPNFTITPTTPAGSNTQIQFNNSGSFGASSQLIANIGATNTLDIQGSGSTSATNALRIRNSEGTSEFKIDNTGMPSFKIAPASGNRMVGFFGNNTENGNAFINLSGHLDSDAGSRTWTLYQNGSEFELNYGNNRSAVNTQRGLKLDYMGNAYFRSSLNVGSSAYSSNFAGLQVSTNTTALKASVLISGTGFSGGTSTTTKPTLLIEPTGTTSTGWSTSGTKLGINAESGFTGNLMDLQLNGSSIVNVLSNGNLRLETGSLNVPAGNIYAGGEIYSSTYVGVTNRFSINSPSDGIITIRNFAATDLNRVNFGGTTSSFPAIKRNGAGLDFRLADDSGFAAIKAREIQIEDPSGFPKIVFFSGIERMAISRSSGDRMLISAYGVNYNFLSATSNLFSDTDIGTGVTTNAKLELRSTARGFLPPRLTTAQRDAVTWVAGDAGMMIYNTTTNKHQGWDGSTWNDFY